MAVHDWVASARSVETYEPFSGKLSTGGVLIGSPEFVDGVDGKALKCDPQEGATIRATAEAARGYPLSVSCWFTFDSGAATVPIFTWGTTPGVSAILYGSSSSEQPGTIEASVRMSNGRYALRVRSGQLAPSRWHLVTITVEQSTIWGGARAVAYVNGEVIGSGSYAGSLFDIVNFDRTRTVMVAVGDGAVSVDEFVAQEAGITSSEVRSLYSSADSLDAGTGPGFGIVF